MSWTSVERVSSPNHLAELQLTGIEPATLVTGPSNFEYNYTIITLVKESVSLTLNFIHQTIRICYSNNIKAYIF